MAKPRPQYRLILQTLAEHEVDFIVIGGVCAVLHGASVSTFDVDIVHSRAPDNLERLTQALGALGAHYRLHSKRIAPTAAHLASPGHHLLDTTAGPLDVLGTIIEDQGYAELLPHAAPMPLGLDLTVQVLSLEKLIDVKEKTGRPKDLATLDVLRDALREHRRRDEGADV